MKGPLILMLVALVCFPVCAKSDVVREIELTDGSRIQAEVVSLSQGVYTLRSESLGEIEIPAEKIKTIRLAGTGESSSPTLSASPSPQQSTPAVNSQVSNVQLSLMQNPANVDTILSLQEDPLVQSILNDAETMKAIKAGDIGTLLTNPKIRALMGHPTIQGMSQEYGE
jgi:hypothetical protein